MSKRTFYDTWSPVTSRIARYVAYDFPDVESEDLAQDLLVEVLNRGWENESPDNQRITLILKKVAKSRAAQYRAEHYILSPQFNYRISDVRRILETVFEANDWLKAALSARAEVGSRSSGEPSYNMDEVLVSHSDVHRAWKRLPHQYKVAIFLRYGLKEDPETENAGRQLRRAVARLTETLNSYQPRSVHEGPGSRSIASNARAEYLIRADYNPSNTSPGSYRQ